MHVPNAFTLKPVAVGGLVTATTAVQLPGATTWRADAVGAGLEAAFAAGTLAATSWLAADFLLEGDCTAVFLLQLAEEPEGPVFDVWFSLLNQCQARMRLPLTLTDQHTRTHPREGAWKNIICQGQRVNPAKVTRLKLTLLRKADGPVVWAMTPLVATSAPPPVLREPLLPAGPLIDPLGQSRLRDWDGKSRGSEEVTARLRRQAGGYAAARWPGAYSDWGGWKARRFDGTGFFRTQHDGRRWWLVDPEGHPFWSTGPDCVGIGSAAAYEGIETAHEWLPDPSGPFAEAFGQSGAFGGHKRHFSFLQANLMRAFGGDYREQWARAALAEMKRIGFNSFGNWSDWRVARQHRFPYVYQLNEHAPAAAPHVFRDMPDVFHPAFEADCAAYAAPLAETADDPALIGYFLTNEPQWGFIAEPVMQGILLGCPECHTRRAFARYLAGRYGDASALAEAWKMRGLTFEAIAAGPWRQPPGPAAQPDLEAFSTVVVKRCFDMMSAACRAVDPHHLNLGGRYYTSPPAWAQAGMTAFDVIGVNGYSQRVRRELEPFSRNIGKPVIIGEWHFGSLDAGLPASGIGHVRDQTDRGRAYRCYLEDAAALPWCVGAHWFTLYDEPAQGRFDGENYNIGFLDICHRPYAPLAAAARASHDRLYQVAAGEAAPYDEKPEYLPLLF